MHLNLQWQLFEYVCNGTESFSHIDLTMQEIVPSAITQINWLSGFKKKETKKWKPSN